VPDAGRALARVVRENGSNLGAVAILTLHVPLFLWMKRSSNSASTSSVKANGDSSRTPLALAKAKCRSGR
jgi:hypothetical protein